MSKGQVLTILVSLLLSLGAYTAMQNRLFVDNEFVKLVYVCISVVALFVVIFVAANPKGDSE